MEITKETPIAALTVGQFEELFLRKQSEAENNQSKEKRYVYGIRGIADLLGCSRVTAQRYKDSFLRPAVCQRGRVIVTDADKAIELFNSRERQS